MKGSDAAAALATHIGTVIEPMLTRARTHVLQGNDTAAQDCYIEILRIDKTHRGALLAIGDLALRGGYRDAARTAFAQAASAHADDIVPRITLGNMALEDGDPQLALIHYVSALAVQPECPQAYQGMARVYAMLGKDDLAGVYREKGFRDHAMAAREYRGAGEGGDILYLAAATGGNVRLRPWIDDRMSAVTVIYPEYFEPDAKLPPHRLIVNAIGDADLCGDALTAATKLVARSRAPVINHPALVKRTGREMVARLCAGIENLVAPETRLRARSDILGDATLNFPLLIRSPGFHTGHHFVLVERREMLAEAVATLPGEFLFTIAYLDACGTDGFARKYRVMFVDGRIYPWHLAISRDWKVHYFTADMAAHAVFRNEERRFLTDMPRVLGARAMQALESLNTALGLDYAGVDFALDKDGQVLLFEANAAMTINRLPPDPMWDYRRHAVQTVQAALQQLLAESWQFKTDVRLD